MRRVIESGLDEPAVVEAVVLEETLVLGRDEGVHHERRNLVVREVNAAFAGEGLNRVALETADVGRERRLVREQVLR